MIADAILEFLHNDTKPCKERKYTLPVNLKKYFKGLKEKNT